MSRNRNQNHQHQQRRIGYNSEPERTPIVVPEGAAPQILIPVTREEYTEMLRRSVTLDIIIGMIDKKDSYMDVRPIQKMLGLHNNKKEDDE